MKFKKTIVILALSILSLILIVLSSHILFKKPSNFNRESVRSMPAPIGFEYPIEIKSACYPMHPNEDFIIQPKVKSWSGKEVRIYFLSEDSDNGNELLYKHILPSDAKLIGKVPIINNEWHFKWKAQKNKIKKGVECFYVIAISNNGVISGERLDVLQYDKFEISPKTPNTGGTASYSGSGFPNGCCVEVELMKIIPGIYPGETIAQLGSFHRTNGSFSNSFSLDQQQYGHDITPGHYILEAIIIPKDESKEARSAVMLNFDVK